MVLLMILCQLCVLCGESLFSDLRVLRAFLVNKYLICHQGESYERAIA